MRIFKYPLVVTDEQTVRMPGARPKILSAQVQNGTICLWALVDAASPVISDVKISIFGTGNPLPENVGTMVFIDTVQLHGGSLVFHVFQNEARA